MVPADGPLFWYRWTISRDIFTEWLATRSLSRWALDVGTLGERPASVCGTSMRRPSVPSKVATRSFIGREAAHGLDQQLVGALVGCLSADSIVLETPIMRRDQETMIRFEALLERRSTDGPSLAEIGVALGVSQPVLHRYCRMHLGMSPANYLHFRTTQHLRPKG